MARLYTHLVALSTGLPLLIPLSAASPIDGAEIEADATCALQLPMSARTENLWEWRKDVSIAEQTTACPGNPDCSLYWSCTGGGGTVMGEQATENGTTFVQYRGRSEVSLFNSVTHPGQRGCLLRRARVPIDLSRIGRIELDVKTTGAVGRRAPWYAMWLAPMIYVFDEENTASETNLIENFPLDEGASMEDVDNVVSRFPACSPDKGYTDGFCKALSWDVPAAQVDHHITLTARDCPINGRVIQVRHCKNGAVPKRSCKGGRHSEIKVTKPNPSAPGMWFPIWNKTFAGDLYGHYVLTTDIWFTSGTDFQFTTSNVKFFENNGREWKP